LIKLIILYLMLFNSKDNP